VPCSLSLFDFPRARDVEYHRAEAHGIQDVRQNTRDPTAVHLCPNEYDTVSEMSKPYYGEPRVFTHTCQATRGLVCRASAK